MDKVKHYRITWYYKATTKCLAKYKRAPRAILKLTCRK
jgi:hypothetical protein